MRIEIEHYSNSYCIEIPDDSSVTEVYDMLMKLLVLVGYDRDAIMEVAQGYTE